MAVAKAYTEGLFTIGTINRFPEVSAWATANGYELEDKPVVRLFEVYDDLVENITQANFDERAPEEDEGLGRRHAAILRAAQEIETEMADGAFPELSRLYDGYIVRFPAESNRSG